MNDTTFKEYLESNKVLIYSTTGTSMLPLIREGLDTVQIEKPNRKIRKYDVVLYVRDNGQYVLHRVVRVRKDGYVLIGDNQYILEKGVRRDQIIGIMVAVFRGEKLVKTTSMKYKLYSRRIVWFRFLRRVIKKIFLMLKVHKKRCL